MKYIVTSILFHYIYIYFIIYIYIIIYLSIYHFVYICAFIIDEKKTVNGSCGRGLIHQSSHIGKGSKRHVSAYPQLQ
jgi:hypothetical protein